jgi:hypothetical protein
MIIHFTNFGMFFEPTNLDERDRMADVFMEKVYDTIYKENGLWKHKGMDSVCGLIECISKENGIPLRMKYKPSDDILGMQLKDRDMKYLPIILKEFKIRYRKGD